MWMWSMIPPTQRRASKFILGCDGARRHVSLLLRTTCCGWPPAPMVVVSPPLSLVFGLNGAGTLVSGLTSVPCHSLHSARFLLHLPSAHTAWPPTTTTTHNVSPLSLVCPLPLHPSSCQPTVCMPVRTRVLPFHVASGRSVPPSLSPQCIIHLVMV